MQIFIVPDTCFFSAILIKIHHLPPSQSLPFTHMKLEVFFIFKVHLKHYLLYSLSGSPGPVWGDFLASLVAFCVFSDTPTPWWYTSTKGKKGKDQLRRDASMLCQVKMSDVVGEVFGWLLGDLWCVTLGHRQWKIQITWSLR